MHALPAQSLISPSNQIINFSFRYTFIMAELSENQVTLLAGLVGDGQVSVHMLSYHQGGVHLGPIPLMIVAPGFLGEAGGWVYGGGDIRGGLEEVLAILLDQLFMEEGGRWENSGSG